MIVIGYDLVSYLLHHPSARCVTFKELFVCKSNNKTGDFEMNLLIFSSHTSFSVKTVLSVGTPSPKRFWTNVCQLPHKRRKWLCLTPKQQFRLMMQGPFLLCLCQRGAFTDSQTISFFAVPLCHKRKAVSDRQIHKWNKPSHAAGKPGRMILSVRHVRSNR